MSTFSESTKRQLSEWINERDRTHDVWTTHVDELANWRPKKESLDEWVQQSIRLYTEASSLVLKSGVVVVAVAFEPSNDIELFKSPASLALDFFTPPSIYILKEALTFPVAGEAYLRVSSGSEMNVDLSTGFLILRSARSLQGLRSGWEFDNTLYISNKLGG